MNKIGGVYNVKHRLGADSSTVFLAENQQGNEVFIKELIVKDRASFEKEFEAIRNKTYVFTMFAYISHGLI